MLQYANEALGIIGGIATIVGFVLAIREPHKRYFHAFYLLLIAAGVSAATYEFSLNARVASIERAADKLDADRDMQYTQRGFVFAALAFLEKNKDIYLTRMPALKKPASSLNARTRIVAWTWSSFRLP
jgi:hypothetical protein